MFQGGRKIFIAHNTEADFTSRHLGITNKVLAKSTEKLSPGGQFIRRSSGDVSIISRLLGK